MAKNFKQTLEENIEAIKEYVSAAQTLSEVCLILDYCDNGRNTGTLSRFLTANDIKFSHFRNGKAKAIMVECICPQCGGTFTKNSTDKRLAKKATCSYNCANKYFAEKQQFGRHLGTGFNQLVHYHRKLTEYLPTIGLKKECVVCKEAEILECHHVDEDHNNDDINNLVFLCPTHHTALHKYKSEAVFDKIVEHLDYRDTLNN